MVRLSYPEMGNLAMRLTVECPNIPMIWIYFGGSPSDLLWIGRCESVYDSKYRESWDHRFSRTKGDGKKFDKLMTGLQAKVNQTSMSLYERWAQKQSDAINKIQVARWIWRVSQSIAARKTDPPRPNLLGFFMGKVLLRLQCWIAKHKNEFRFWWLDCKHWINYRHNKIDIFNWDQQWWNARTLPCWGELPLILNLALQKKWSSYRFWEGKYVMINFGRVV